MRSPAPLPPTRLLQRLDSHPAARGTVTGLSLLLALGLCLYLGERLDIEHGPLGFDWKISLTTVLGGRIEWVRPELDPSIPHAYFPPWNVFVLLPFGLLPINLSWGLLLFLTVGVLLLSIPRGLAGPRLYWLAAGLLVFSLISLSSFADGAVEGLVIAGLLLLARGYERERPLWLAAGFILATMKPQAAALVLVVLAGYCLQARPARFYLTAELLILAVVIPALIRWWLPWRLALAQGLPPGISWSGLFAMLRLPGTFAVPLQLATAGLTLLIAWRGDRRLAHAKLGLLVAGSMLAAPYANTHSLLLPLALGIVPLFLVDRPLGSVLLVLCNLPFLVIARQTPQNTLWYQLYWSGLLVVTWAALARHVFLTEVRGRAPVSP